MKGKVTWIISFLWHHQATQAFLPNNARASSMPMMSIANENNHDVHVISLETYLQETMDAIDPSFQFSVSEQHRKSMIQAILGISKVQMDADLRDLRARMHWIEAERFVREELRSLSTPPDPDIAPQFEEGLRDYEKFEPDHTRLFSFLARGRTYKGQLALLLNETSPELIPSYQRIVDKIPDLELLECYVREQDPKLQDILLRCATIQLPKASVLKPERAQEKGELGETSLQTYLEDMHKKESVLTNVFVNNKSTKGKRQKSECVIEIPPSVTWEKMTSELDAIVVEPINDGDESAVITSVWEAKATLHPTTIYDALSKKYAAVSTVFQTDDVKLCLKEKGELALRTDKLPQMGIFGTNLLPPAAACRKLQIVLCEKNVGSSPEAVQEALDTGKMSVSREEVQFVLERALCLAREIQPIVVVASPPKVQNKPG